METITDNGKGMGGAPLQKLNKSKGIMLVKERLALFDEHNSNPIAIASELGGTNVQINIAL